MEHPCDKMQSFLFVMANLYIASVSLDDVFGYGMLIVFFGYFMDKFTGHIIYNNAFNIQFPLDWEMHIISLKLWPFYRMYSITSSFSSNGLEIRILGFFH